MIRFMNVHRSYDNIPAVDNVSFDIGNGEVVGMLGHNGAGKTTIMKMMTGFLEPTSGIIEVDGLEMGKDTMAIKRKIGYLPENCPVYSDMPVFDYLCHAGALHGIDSGEIEGHVKEAMCLTKIVSRADRRISTLSRGYRQRVGVAQAILHKPDILILDEPTNGLDPTQIVQMRSLIRDLSKRSTIIISTHILHEVQAVCDRAIIIQNGKKVMDAGLSDLQSSRSIILDTDLEGEKAMYILESIEGVSSVWPVEQVGGLKGRAQRYAMDITDEADMELCSSMAAARIMEGGGSVFALFPESRDLESIFGEITASEGGVQ